MGDADVWVLSYYKETWSVKKLVEFTVAVYMYVREALKENKNRVIVHVVVVQCLSDHGVGGRVLCWFQVLSHFDACVSAPPRHVPSSRGPVYVLLVWEV